MFGFKGFYQPRPRQRPRQNGALKPTPKPAYERTGRAKRPSTLTTRDNHPERAAEKPRGHERACGRACADGSERGPNHRRPRIKQSTKAARKSKGRACAPMGKGERGRDGEQSDPKRANGGGGGFGGAPLPPIGRHDGRGCEQRLTATQVKRRRGAGAASRKRKSSPQRIGRGGTTGAGYGRPLRNAPPRGGHNMAGCGT